MLVQDLVGTWYHKGWMSRMCGEMRPNEAGQTSITRRSDDGAVRLLIRVHKKKLHVWVHSPLGRTTWVVSCNSGLRMIVAQVDALCSPPHGWVKVQTRESDRQRGECKILPLRHIGGEHDKGHTKGLEECGGAGAAALARQTHCCRLGMGTAAGGRKVQSGRVEVARACLRGPQIAAALR